MAAAAQQGQASHAAPASDQLKRLQQRVKLQQAHVDKLEAWRGKQPNWRLDAFEADMAERALLDGLVQQRDGLQPTQQRLTASIQKRDSILGRCSTFYAMEHVCS